MITGGTQTVSMSMVLLVLLVAIVRFSRKEDEYNTYREWYLNPVFGIMFEQWCEEKN